MLLLTVLSLPYTDCLGILMKFPPIDDVRSLVQKALHIRNPTVRASACVRVCVCMCAAATHVFMRSCVFVCMSTTDPQRSRVPESYCPGMSHQTAP